MTTFLRLSTAVLLSAPLVLTGCAIARAPILQAASTGDDMTLKQMIAGGANLETTFLNGCAVYPQGFRLQRAGNETPLICAAINGHYNAVKQLLAAGANPHALDFLKRSAQYYAQALGREEISRLLSEKGAHPTGGAVQSAPAAPAAAGVSREELRQMMAEAVRAAAPPAAAAAPSSQPSSDADAPSYRKPQNADDFAVVVGVEKYSGLPDASYAERDAKAVYEHLVALGYPRRNIALLTGAQATRTGLVKNLEAWLPQNINERSNVVFYYSGHGAPDPTGGTAYLVPSDGDPQYLEETAYPVKRLYEKLSALKAKRVLVAMDSCFSGAGGRSVLAKGTRPLVGKIDLGSVGGKVMSLTASSSSQISGTEEAQGHGLFTYYLLRGLNGEAKDGAGAVTVKSLHAYLAPKVQDEAKRVNRDQTPQLLPPSPADDFKLR